MLFTTELLLIQSLLHTHFVQKLYSGTYVVAISLEFPIFFQLEFQRPSFIGAWVIAAVVLVTKRNMAVECKHSKMWNGMNVTKKEHFYRFDFFSVKGRQKGVHA